MSPLGGTARACEGEGGQVQLAGPWQTRIEACVGENQAPLPASFLGGTPPKGGDFLKGTYPLSLAGAVPLWEMLTSTPTAAIDMINAVEP